MNGMHGIIDMIDANLVIGATGLTEAHGADDLVLLLPELFVLAAALTAFIGSTFASVRRGAWLLTTLLSLGAVVMAALTLHKTGEPFFPGIYRVDLFSQLVKLGLGLGLFLTLLTSAELPSVRRSARPDLAIFLAFGALGMMLLVSATELLTLYVTLELSAYALYVLASLHRDENRGSEGGAKYLLFGAVASALTLYGISFLFGATGSTQLSAIAAAPSSPMLILGVVVSLAGLLFKLAVLPFHAWAPDTYQAAPHQSATFIGTASKVAAIAVLCRVLTLGHEAPALKTLLVVLAVVSMTVGNLAAMVQTDLKRLLAWSTVAHAGYVLLGLMTLNELGAAAAIFYGLIYLVVAFATFLAVSQVGQGDNPSVASLAGLYKRAPLVGVLLLAGLFGLAGVPPTPGFSGKWFLFSAAMDSGHFWVVLVGAVNATISLYYYLRVVRAAYQTVGTDSAEDVAPMSVSVPYRIAAWSAMALIVVVGVYPGPLWTLAQGAAKALGR